MHKLGYNYKPTQVNELETALFSSGLSAEESAAKLAAFKMGYLSKITDAAIAGDRQAFESLNAVMRSKRGLGQYFSADEVSSFMDSLRPKMEASFNLKQLLKSAERYSGETDTAANELRAGFGALNKSLNTTANAAISWIQKRQFGPAVANKIMQFIENPSSGNFNRLIKGTNDLLEKQTLFRNIKEALLSQQMQEQAAIRVIEENIGE